MNFNIYGPSQEDFLFVVATLIIYFSYRWWNKNECYSANFQLFRLPCVSAWAFLLFEIAGPPLPSESRDYLANRLLLLNLIVFGVQLICFPQYQQHFDLL